MLFRSQALRARSFMYQDAPQRQIGFIAQEVEDIVPEVVYEDSEGFRTLAYDRLTALLCQAVQELTMKVAALEAKLAG